MNHEKKRRGKYKDKWHGAQNIYSTMAPSEINGYLKLLFFFLFRYLTLKMASAQVVETSVANKSPSQDSSHPDFSIKVHPSKLLVTIEMTSMWCDWRTGREKWLRWMKGTRCVALEIDTVVNYRVNLSALPSFMIICLDLSSLIPTGSFLYVLVGQSGEQQWYNPRVLRSIRLRLESRRTHGKVIRFDSFLLDQCVIAYRLPTLPAFSGVSRFFIKSPGLPARAPDLPGPVVRKPINLI